MNRIVTLLRAGCASTFVVAIAFLLTFGVAWGQDSIRVPTLHGQGIVTTDASPPATQKAGERVVPHVGYPDARITTTVLPAHAAIDVVATPVPHAGAGVITTRSGPTIPPVVAGSERQAKSTPVGGGPSLTVTASCTADAQGAFTIVNSGGGMTVPFTYRLSLNGTPIATGTFQLNAGASTSVHTAGLFGTLTLELLDASNAVVASGTTYCQAPPVPPPPSFTVTADCTADAQGTFTITDVGGDMPVPFAWRLSLNGTVLANSSFKLTAGASTQVRTAGLFGDMTLDVLDASNAVLASASTFCPTPPPPPPPSFTVSASCTADGQGTFTITDVGGSMTSPSTWRLSLDGTELATGTFQLNAGASTHVNTAGLFGTLTLDILGAGSAVVASASTLCHTAPPPGPPAFTVVATCTADANGTITITDVGGSMTTPFSWRLKLGGTQIATGTFQLNAGQSTPIHTAGLFGALTLEVLDTSGTVVASGSTFCPTPPPPLPPSFTVSANCSADATGVITIDNVGGNMTVPFTWHLTQNGTPIAQSTFQLASGHSTTINTSGILGTIAVDIFDASNHAIASASMVCAKPRVAVPNVLGLSQAAATSAITGAGLVVGAVTTASSTTVPAGRVISESPAAGTSVASGSTVSLVVSSGANVADVNHDGVVNCTDLAIVKASFGKRNGQPGFDPRADVNHDGVVNIVDLSTVAHALPAGTVCP